MLKLICFSALVASAASLVWKSCSTDPSNTVLTVHEFDISPNPIVFPGELQLTVNLTVNRRIEHLYINTELRKQSGLFGQGLVVPCIGDTNIGSCQSINACTVLDRILNGSSVISSDLGLQLDSLLLSALGHRATCPVNPETVAVHNQKVTLHALPTLLGAIGDGDYNIKIILKEDDTDTSTDNVGCLSFDASIRRGATSLFPGVGKK